MDGEVLTQPKVDSWFWMEGVFVTGHLTLEQTKQAIHRWAEKNCPERCANIITQVDHCWVRYEKTNDDQMLIVHCREACETLGTDGTDGPFKVTSITRGSRVR